MKNVLLLSTFETQKKKNWSTNMTFGRCCESVRSKNRLPRTKTDK